MSRRLFGTCLLSVATLFMACSPSPSKPATTPQKQDNAIATSSTLSQSAIEEMWLPLYTKLKDDGIYGDDITQLFIQLNGKFTQKPMGFKIIELHTSAFEPQKKYIEQRRDTPHSSGIPQPLDYGIATDATAKMCIDYINTHSKAFHYAEEKFGVPKAIISALLYVETRHGSFLGRNDTFITLASMSASNQFAHIPNYLKKIKEFDTKSGWVQTKLDDKSQWAYTELKAFLIYCRENKINPLAVPSSIYGAIGHCQFMPTNIPIFAVDGDGDGYIHLFKSADAIASVANYLQKNGWKGKRLPTKKQFKALRRYNNSASYANTIMALAILIERLEKTTR